MSKKGFMEGPVAGPAARRRPPLETAVSKLKKISAHVLVCKHKTCLKQGGKASAKALKRALKERGLRERVMITKVKCLDQCGRGPVMVVYPDGVWYGGVDEEAARDVVARHVEGVRVAPGRILHEMPGRGAEGR